MIKQFRSTTAEINLIHLSHNLDLIQKKAGTGRFVCPMVKANAYGHGLVPVAQHISRHYQFPLGVALVEEAVELRQAGIESQIIVFGGFNKASLPAIIDYKLTAVVSQLEQLEMIREKLSGTSTSLEIHMKFNTGMNRLGFKMNQISTLNSFLHQYPEIKMGGALTHFHSGHLLCYKNSSAHKQLFDFDTICEEFNAFDFIPHLFNSDAISVYDQNESILISKRDWGFRPGIMIYGYVGSEDLKNKMKLKPVMTLTTSICSIQKIKKGESVSYNATWKAERDSVIGILEIGYADGVNRSLSNKGLVYVNHQQVPIVGTVCMDFLMVDLTDMKKADSLLNAPVLFFGSDSGADQLAELAGTISYEILTSVSSRVPRVYTNDSKKMIEV